MLGDRRFLSSLLSNSRSHLFCVYVYLQIILILLYVVSSSPASPGSFCSVDAGLSANSKFAIHTKNMIWLSFRVNYVGRFFGCFGQHDEPGKNIAGRRNADYRRSTSKFTDMIEWSWLQTEMKDSWRRAHILECSAVTFCVKLLCSIANICVYPSRAPW